MNSAQEWDDVLQHVYLEDFFEILIKVVSQCSLMYLSTSALLVLVGGGSLVFCVPLQAWAAPICQITRGWATENQYLFIAHRPLPCTL